MDNYNLYVAGQLEQIADELRKLERNSRFFMFRGVERSLKDFSQILKKDDSIKLDELKKGKVYTEAIEMIKKGMDTHSIAKRMYEERVRGYTG
jgi:ClpP class serine protease